MPPKRYVAYYTIFGQRHAAEGDTIEEINLEIHGQAYPAQNVRIYELTKEKENENG